MDTRCTASADCALRACPACDWDLCLDHDASCGSCDLTLSRCACCRALAVDAGHVALELGYAASDVVALTALLADDGWAVLTDGACGECRAQVAA